MEKIQIIHTFWGFGIGDAKGLGYEFKDRNWLREHAVFDTYINARTGKWAEGIEPGTYSDDTEHTIGVIRALLHTALPEKNFLLDFWAEEYLRDKQRKGYPRQGHGSIKDWYEGRLELDDIRQSQLLRDHPGNAPVMRAIPFGLMPNKYRNHYYAYALNNAYTTHPHPEAVIATVLIIYTVHYLLVLNLPVERLVDYLCTVPSIQHMNMADLKRIPTLSPPDVLTDKELAFLCGEQPIPMMKKHGLDVYGLNCEALATAYSVIYLLHHCTSAYEALQQSIWMGGDVDSLAALTVGICAGKYSIETLPTQLLEQLEGKDRLERLADEFYEKYYA